VKRIEQLRDRLHHIEGDIAAEVRWLLGEHDRVLRIIADAVGLVVKTEGSLSDLAAALELLADIKAQLAAAMAERPGALGG
jgi:hypothetical protein